MKFYSNQKIYTLNTFVNQLNYVNILSLLCLICCGLKLGNRLFLAMQEPVKKFHRFKIIWLL